VTPEKRRHIRIRGVVQGVGFRPFVYRIANEMKICGNVLNDSDGVLVDAEALPDVLRNFEQRLTSEAPAASRIDTVSSHAMPYFGYEGFSIEHSADAEGRTGRPPVDLALCADCKRELLDPHNRRYAYPFINCTNCGPRYTIIKSLPYDRPATTMAGFPICDPCNTEYRDPVDRRFHAQPVACHDCGPTLQLLDPKGNAIKTDDPVAHVIEVMGNGGIAAIKGLGGFHLTCDATNGEAIAALRSRKQRDERPFAVMMDSLETINEHAEVAPVEADMLQSHRAPVVILRRKANSPLPRELAPGQNTLGVMLPYTPLHVLLFAHPAALAKRPLVMTSGNVHDEPIVFKDEETLARLAPMADVILTHNRPILIRCDDSVARVYGDTGVVIRRARGFTPEVINLPSPLDCDVLAVGPELKNTICLGRDSEAIPSHHIGDMENPETEEAFREVIGHFESVFKAEPKIIVHDLHPDFLSTRYAIERCEKQGLQRIAVQHHVAHTLSVMAEHGIMDKVIGFSFDGTGYGDDGTLWGSEVFVMDGDIRRAAHLEAVPLPGGEKAIDEPWRQALGLLSYLQPNTPLPPALAEQAASPAGRIISTLVNNRSKNLLWTTSLGRLFDAVSAMLGIRDCVSYEGQAAIELEALSDRNIPLNEAYPVAITKNNAGRYEVSPAPLIAAIMEDMRQGTSMDRIGGAFHAAIVSAFGEIAQRLRNDTGLHTVVLSGGCFLNDIIVTRMQTHLRDLGFTVYIHKSVPPTDGGVSLGQLFYVWRMQHVHGSSHETH